MCTLACLSTVTPSAVGRCQQGAAFIWPVRVPAGEQRGISCWWEQQGAATRFDPGRTPYRRLVAAVNNGTRTTPLVQANLAGQASAKRAEVDAIRRQELQVMRRAVGTEELLGLRAM